MDEERNGTNAEAPEEKGFFDRTMRVYNSRRDRLIQLREDEVEFLKLHKLFKNSSKELAGEARSMSKYTDDTDLKILAQDILDIIKSDLLEVTKILEEFSQAHVKAGEQEIADSIDDEILKTDHLGTRVSATIYIVKHGKDANLGEIKENEEAIDYAVPKVKHLHQTVAAPRALYVYPIPATLPNETVPDWPMCFQKYLELPPEDMEIAENGSLKIPEGYRDAEGNDLTHLFEVDWETGLVRSELSPEETQNGRVEWAAWVREYPGAREPELLKDYNKRLVKKYFGGEKT